ncbi:MAG: hypothetical protein H0X25_18115 [Acidobacteriales bacterium]|nr:hypothetical protein [Terriglobales bacterium]
MLLGNAVIKTTGTWFVPTEVEIVGLGALSTTIQSGGASPVISMGTGTSALFGIKVRELAVDCNNVANCKGIVNAGADEGSFVEDVIISNAPKTALEVDLPTGSGSTMAANSGAYRNITITYSNCSNCGAATAGVVASGGDCGQVIRGFDNVTISACGASVAAGFLVTGASTRIADSTINCTTTGIQIGTMNTGGTACNGQLAPTSTHNVEVENTFLSQTATNPILVGPSTSDVMLSNVSSDTSNLPLVYDEGIKQNSPLSIPCCFVGFYVRGECCVNNTNSALATSVTKDSAGNNIIWDAPVGYLHP